MNQYSEKYIGQRLKKVRKELGFSLKDIAELVGFNNYQTLSNLEKGQRGIKVSELTKLCRIYHKDIWFFLDENEPKEPKIQMAWRDLAIDEKRNQIEAKIRKHVSNFRMLEKLNDIKSVNKDYIWPSSTSITNFSDIENKAYQVINDLDLGTPPAANLSQAMQEKLGINIIYFDLGDYSSGVTAIDDKGVFVFVNASDIKGRRNFDLAHELFHIFAANIYPLSKLQKFHHSPLDKVETFANVFASSLLLPKDQVRSDFMEIVHNNKFNIYDIIPLAHKYKVSNIAFLWRLCNLGFIDSETVEVIKQNEQFNQRSRMMRCSDYNCARIYSEHYVWMALKALISGSISKGKFCKIFDIKRSEFSNFICEYGFLEDYLNEWEIQLSNT